MEPDTTQKKYRSAVLDAHIDTETFTSGSNPLEMLGLTPDELEDMVLLMRSFACFRYAVSNNFGYKLSVGLHAEKGTKNTRWHVLFIFHFNFEYRKNGFAPSHLTGLIKRTFQQDKEIERLRIEMTAIRTEIVQSVHIERLA